MSYFDQLSKDYILNAPKEHDSDVENNKNVFVMAVPNEIFEKMKQGSSTLKKSKLKTTNGTHEFNETSFIPPVSIHKHNNKKLIIPSNYIHIPADYNSQPCEYYNTSPFDNGSKQCIKRDSESKQSIPRKKRKKVSTQSSSNCIEELDGKTKISKKIEKAKLINDEQNKSENQGGKGFITKKPLIEIAPKSKLPYVPQVLTEEEEQMIDDAITNVIKKYSIKSDQAKVEMKDPNMSKENQLNLSLNSTELSCSKTNVVSLKNKKTKKSDKLTPIKPIIAEKMVSSTPFGDLNLSLNDDNECEASQTTNVSSQKKKKKKKRKHKELDSSLLSNDSLNDVSLITSNCEGEQSEKQNIPKSTKKTKKSMSDKKSDEIAIEVEKSSVSLIGLSKELNTTPVMKKKKKEKKKVVTNKSDNLASEKLNGSDYEFDIDKELIPKVTKMKKKQHKKLRQETDSEKKECESPQKTASEVNCVDKKEKKKKKKHKK